MPASKLAANRRTLKDRREDDVVQQEQTLLDHRQHVHQSAGALRARRALLHRWRLQMIPTAPSSQ